MIYKINNKLQLLKEINFKLEKDLEEFINNNLTTLTGLQLIEAYSRIDNYIFDALAYNQETNSFVIIEYKKVRCEHLVDQGFAYLGTMLNRKAEFVLKFNNKNNTNMSINNFDWSQSRVMFISPAFSNYQLDSSAYIKLPFDLYSIKRYEDNIILFEKIEDKRTNKEDLLNSNSIINTNPIMKEITVYTEDDHLKKTDDTIKELYYQIKNRMYEWGEYSIEPKKIYIAFKKKTNIIDFEFYRHHLKIWLNLKKGALIEKNNLMEDCSTKGHSGNGDYELTLKNDENIDYLMSLIKQSWNKNN